MKDKTYSRSLRTTNKRVALAAARDFFHEITAKVYGSMVNVKAERELLYEDLVEPTLAIERARVARGEFGAATLRHLQARMKNTIVPFAGKIPIKRFGYAHGSDFIEMMSKKGMGSTTIQQHIVGMRKVLNYA